MKTFILVIIVFGNMQINIFPQSVYSTDMEKDIFIGFVSLGAGLTPFFINKEPNSIPVSPDKNEMNAFDRSLMFSYNKNLDILSDYCFAYTLASLPVISVLSLEKSKNVLFTYVIMYGESLLLTYGTAFSLKNGVVRYRPYMYHDCVPNGKENDYHNSFPSGASAFSFLGATFLSVTFSREFPESEWKLPVIIGAYTLAAGTGAMRILSGAHFLTDVITGAAIGSLYGWLVPYLHLNNAKSRFAVTPAPNGIMFSIRS